MKISGGKTENGIVFGNTYDKYGSRNPIVQRMMAGFEKSLTQFVTYASPKSIHEIGCGEGHWVTGWNAKGYNARGCDFSHQVIDIAKENAAKLNLFKNNFKVRSIYDLDSKEDCADLIVCCEVLEHLEDPIAGLSALQSVTDNYIILSVPREPLWRVLNFSRGKYLSNWGNTPGHLQHWSKKEFVDLLQRYFKIISVESPLPWTMVLCQKK